MKDFLPGNEPSGPWLRKINPFLRPRPEASPVGGNVGPAAAVRIRELPNDGVSHPVSGADEVLVLTPDPRRMTVILSLNGDGTPVYARSGDNPKGTGFKLDPDGVPLVLHRKDFGELVCGSWWIGPYNPPAALTAAVYVQDTFSG